MEVLLDKTYISKCIHIIRDPRAIAASNYVSGLCYPNLFLARQWRKSAALAKINKSRFPDRYLIVKYEDLVTNKRSSLKEICDFLEVKFDYNMLDSKKITDGAGELWSQNTSYSKTNQSLYRWRKHIPAGHQKVIDFVCYEGLSIMVTKFQKNRRLQN